MDRPQEYYEEKILRLQEDIASLRLSRRVLMNVLEQVQSERRQEREKASQQIKSLQMANTRYARALWRSNCQQMQQEG